MDQVATSKWKDSECAELELVLVALARTPRLESFLRFIAERYLQNRINEINEYNIATEVLGRSKNSFDASRDSIARVEAHRLRKRLREYYETEGREHVVQISLPQGSYVPAFTRRASSPPMRSVPELQDDVNLVENLPSALIADKQEAPVSSKTGIVQAGYSKLRTFRKQTLLFVMAGIVALFLVFFGVVRFSLRSKSSDRLGSVASLPLNAARPSPQDAAQIPLRLLAGYDGNPKIDGAGEYWQVDRYFHGGAAFQRPNSPVLKTSDPMLFDHWRTGDFTYDIPLAPGTYELHLFFIASPQDDPKSSYFNVSLNGQPLLSPFNIGDDALGANIADERVFKDIHPDKDGFLHLKFFMDRSSATLNALEILPGLPHRQIPVRLVAQQSAVMDHNGNLWHPDDYYQGGTLSDPPRQVNDTPDPNLYTQERYGHFTYTIPVDTRSRYTLILHFAELYWISNPWDRVGVGSRVFRVYCNGSTLLDNFDIFKETGSLHPLTKTFNHLRPSPEGKLDLTFEPITNQATISAIEVIDESE